MVLCVQKESDQQEIVIVFSLHLKIFDWRLEIDPLLVLNFMVYFLWPRLDVVFHVECFKIRENVMIKI